MCDMCRLLFPGRFAQLTRWRSRPGGSSPTCSSPTSAQAWKVLVGGYFTRALPDAFQVVANRFLSASPKAKRSQDLTAAK